MVKGGGFGWDSTSLTHFGLNDPTVKAYAVDVATSSPNSITFSFGSGDARRRLVWPILPAGTRVQCKMTTNGTTYFRRSEGDGLGPSGHAELVPAMSAGTHVIDVVIQPNTSTHMGFLVSSVGTAVTITDWLVTLPNYVRAPVNLISDHYGLAAGKIGIYYSLDGATYNTNGVLTGIRNLGAAGSPFDAAASGNAIPTANGILDFTTGGGYLESANTIDLNGIHLMYVFNLGNFATVSRWFGSTGFEFRSNVNSDLGYYIQIWSNLSGAGGAGNIITIRQPNTADLVLVEHRFETVGKVSTYINGALIGNNVNIPSTVPQPGPLPLKFIGKGNGAGRFDGKMGDVLGIVCGDGDAAAIAAVRRVLTAKYGITLA